MSTVNDARDGADAVRKFAAEVARRDPAPDRVQARLDGEGGMASLCAVEAELCQRWPASTAKELIWLTRSQPAGGDRLHLRAFAADGEVLHNASFRLERRDA